MSQKTVTSPKIKSPSAKTPHQKEYVKAINDKDIVICQGPAGTGKTHLAVGMGTWYLKKEKVNKLVIARPVVEAGESLGYLPGDIEAKMDPFVRPCFDELEEYASNSDIRTWTNSGKLEIVPIAFMRGRTLKDAFIVCDECQNLDFEQMFMLLTRLGMQSKLVLTGDTDQSDLHHSKRGAFEFSCRMFADYDPKMEVVTLDHSDNQRHPLVAKITEDWKPALDKWRKEGKIAE